MERGIVGYLNKIHNNLIRFLVDIQGIYRSLHERVSDLREQLSEEVRNLRQEIRDIRRCPRNLGTFMAYKLSKLRSQKRRLENMLKDSSTLDFEIKNIINYLLYLHIQRILENPAGIPPQIENMKLENCIMSPPSFYGNFAGVVLAAEGKYSGEKFTFYVAIATYIERYEIMLYISHDQKVVDIISKDKNQIQENLKREGEQIYRIAEVFLEILAKNLEKIVNSKIKITEDSIVTELTSGASIDIYALRIISLYPPKKKNKGS